MTRQIRTTALAADSIYNLRNLAYLIEYRDSAGVFGKLLPGKHFRGGNSGPGGGMRPTAKCLRGRGAGQSGTAHQNREHGGTATEEPATGRFVHVLKLRMEPSQAQ